MSKDSIGASVYSYWQIFMYKSMFHNYIQILLENLQMATSLSTSSE